jgi:SAM-dependent methyltransferase
VKALKPLADFDLMYEDLVVPIHTGGMAMVSSKGWEWEKVNQVYWSKPSEDGVYFADRWSGQGCQHVLDLGAGDASFDCVFVYHAISHSDTAGVQKVIRQIERVLRPGGQLFTSMCSKESWEYTRSGFPRLDENTVVCSDNGPEQDVPHLFADVDDILGLFANFTIEKIRHVDYCYLNGKKQDSKYYYLNGYKSSPQN